LAKYSYPTANYHLSFSHLQFDKFELPFLAIGWIEALQGLAWVLLGTAVARWLAVLLSWLWFPLGD
jgi:hypothetical protein